MKISKRKMMIISAIILLGACIILAYFWWQGEHYVSTIDARVSSDMVNVTPQSAGRLVSWGGYEGQMVSQDEKLGVVDGGITVTSLNAPISGKLVKVNVKEGQSVSLGLNAAVIADMENMFISANIEETAISKVEVGQGVEIRLDAFPGEVYVGKIVSVGDASTSVFSTISSSSSNGNYTKITQLIPIKIAFAKKYEKSFKLGMSVEIKIHVK